VTWVCRSWSSESPVRLVLPRRPTGRPGGCRCSLPSLRSTPG